jgi:hypothetical protein
LGSDGAAFLASALKQNQSLRTLHLGGNGIGSEGAFALAKACRANTSLEILTLSGNAFGVAAYVELTEAASTSPQLKLQVGVAPTSKDIVHQKCHVDGMPDISCTMGLEVEHEEYALDGDDERPLVMASVSSGRLPSDWHLPEDDKMQDSHKALEQLAHAFGSGARKVNRWHRKVQRAAALRIAMQRLASALNIGAQEVARWEEQTGWVSYPRHSFLVVSVTMLPSGRLSCTSMAGREIVNLASGTTLHELLSIISKREQVAEDHIRVVNTEGDLLNEHADSLMHHLAVDDLIHRSAHGHCSDFGARCLQGEESVSSVGFGWIRGTGCNDFDNNSISRMSTSTYDSCNAGKVEPSCWSLAVRMMS